jgi:hypothetical protein
VDISPHNVIGLDECSLRRFGVDSFLYNILYSNFTKGTIPPVRFPRYYYYLVAILAILCPDLINKNISPLIISCLVNLQRASSIGNVDDDS